ncbi:MAG: hypothetical protein LBR80_12580 [Deltaproteobacteria bacterium]|jgi:hypothetical protein|nr:hypothetical protein [Deltaproteobacteria bacterium]
MTKKELDAIMDLAFVTPDILQLFMEMRKVTADVADIILFNSKLYMMMEKPHLKISEDYLYPTLYDMLNDELKTGTITFD